jgi:hypothetical protein
VSEAEDIVQEALLRLHRAREAGERIESRPRRQAEMADSLSLALKGLESLLAADVALHGDGGGKVPAIRRPLHGRGRVARTLLAWAGAAGRLGASPSAASR